MRVSDFSFQLPETLIAQYPKQERTQSRLMFMEGESGRVTHSIFSEIIEYLKNGDLLVFNNTRVIAARLYGQKASGGKIELLVERVLDTHRALVQIRASKSPKVGTMLHFGEEQTIVAEVLSRQADFFEIIFHNEQTILTILDKIGHIPLPPYMTRTDELIDKTRYQTVYATRPGAVAAPTAGLHFDKTLLQALQNKGIEFAFVTLHVGAGTYQPVRVETLEEHVMHAEYLEVSQEVADAVNACKKRGNRVIAVGTTSVRSLESAARASQDRELLQPFTGDSQIFIYPGYHYQIVDGLITNFHLPQSTLIMLVCAFAGYNNTMSAYRVAVEQQYRFFSYGDAMFLTRNPEVERELSAQKY